MRQSTESSAAPDRLHRRLGFWAVTFSGVWVIIGAGIYVLLGAVTGEAGNAVWLSFLLAGVVAAFTGASYARFAAMRPLNAPEFQYAKLAFGARAGFIAGWMVLWADLIAVAVIALGFGGYLDNLTGVPEAIGALGLVALATLLVTWGIGQPVGVAVVFTLIEVAGLLIITAIGMPSWGDADLFDMPHGLAGVWSGATLAFFAYLGFDELGNLAEETHNPKRTLPRALAAALVISTALYLLVGLSAVSVVGWADLQASRAPLALVASEGFGRDASALLSILALAATANTVLLLLLSASRAMYGMASASALPCWLGSVGPTRTPWAGSIVALGVTTAFILIGNVERIARVTDAAILILFFMVNAALFWTLRRRQSRGESASAIGLLMPLLGAGLCALLFLRAGPVGIAVGSGILLAGALLSLWVSRHPTNTTREK